jgi:hypothetical protein
MSSFRKQFSGSNPDTSNDDVPACYRAPCFQAFVVAPGIKQRTKLDSISINRPLRAFVADICRRLLAVCAQPTEQSHAIWTAPARNWCPTGSRFESFYPVDAIAAFKDRPQDPSRPDLLIEARGEITDIVPEPLIQ